MQIKVIARGFILIWDTCIIETHKKLKLLENQDNHSIIHDFFIHKNNNIFYKFLLAWVPKVTISCCDSCSRDPLLAVNCQILISNSNDIKSFVFNYIFYERSRTFRCQFDFLASFGTIGEWATLRFFSG
jgi:hypothetical protein